MILKYFDSNTALSIAGLIVGLCGIILAIYFYLKGKRSKKPYYTLRSFNLISEKVTKFKDIKVLFRDEYVSNLTMTKIAIWNGGNETINYSDLALLDKLRVTPKDNITIYIAELLFQSNPTCQFKTDIVNNEVILTFDFFDQNQGCVLQVTHSGKRSTDLLILGTVKGVGVIKENKVNSLDFAIVNTFASILIPYLRSNKRDKRLFAQFIPWFTLIIGLFVSGLYFIIKSGDSDKIALLISGGLYVLIGLTLLIKRNPIPKNFEQFYEDE